MKKSVLVAGGAGYIGAHVCKALDAAGYLPVTLDNLSTGHRDFVRWGALIEANVSDLGVVSEAVVDNNIEAVIDLAGSIEVAESVANPIKYYDNNFACKLAFLETLKKAGVKAFVFSSTAAVYGEPETVPIPESHKKSPKSPYGWSKLLFEQLLADYHNAGGPAWMALRYFNAAGASFDGDIGEKHEPESHLIPKACFAALGRSESLDVYGNDYPTPDGTAIRDYIHVMDLAKAHILALEALLDGKPSAAYNLGNGIGTSINDILASFTKLGHPVPHSFKPRRAGDPARLVADNSAACKELGFKPNYGDVDSIIKSAYNWHKDN
ncbi:MAG: UDP-glucose 4-epimerase GalE [Rickettsiales bacterium]